VIARCRDTNSSRPSPPAARRPGRGGPAPRSRGHDINMPDGSGIEATREDRARGPRLAILMLTMFDDDDSVFAAMRAGALATCSRARTPRDPARRRLRRHRNAVFGPGVARRAIATCGAGGTEPAFRAEPARARDLELIAGGLATPSSPRASGLSPNTVPTTYRASSASSGWPARGGDNSGRGTRPGH